MRWQSSVLSADPCHDYCPIAGSRDAAAARLGAELSEGIAAGTGQDSGLVLVVACAESAEDVPAPLRRCFTHELALEAPDEAQRLVLLQVCMQPHSILPVHACCGATLSAMPLGGLAPADT